MADSEQAAQDSLPEDNCPVVELVQRDGQPCLDVSTQIWMAKSWAALVLAERSNNESVETANNQRHAYRS